MGVRVRSELVTSQTSGERRTGETERNNRQGRECLGSAGRAIKDSQGESPHQPGLHRNATVARTWLLRYVQSCKYGWRDVSTNEGRFLLRSFYNDWPRSLAQLQGKALLVPCPCRSWKAKGSWSPRRLLACPVSVNQLGKSRCLASP